MGEVNAHMNFFLPDSKARGRISLLSRVSATMKATAKPPRAIVLHSHTDRKQRTGDNLLNITLYQYVSKNVLTPSLQA